MHRALCLTLLASLWIDMDRAHIHTFTTPPPHNECQHTFLAYLLDDAHVAEVHVGGGEGVDNGEHRVRSNGRQDFRVLVDDFGGQAGVDGADEVAAVGQLHRNRRLLQNFVGLWDTNKNGIFIAWVHEGETATTFLQSR